MHPVGKFIITLPIAILLIALLLNSSTIAQKANLDVDGVYRLPTSNTDESSPSDNPFTQFFSGNQGSSSINLEGPLVCSYKDEISDISVKIFQKNIYAEIKQEDQITKVMMVNGDVYKWQHGEYTGEKIVGVGQYVSLLESFSAFISPDMIFSLLPQAQESQTLTSDQVQNLKDSCKPGTIDSQIFSVPKAIKFTEVDVSELQKIEKIEIE